MEGEIQEFEKELSFLRDQSKNVETELVRKLQDISEKYKVAVHERDQLQVRLKDVTGKAHEMSVQLRDIQLYTQAMEKENQFLRLEVERTKYSKDKEGYSKFIGGLMKHNSKGQGKSSNDGGGAAATSSLTRSSIRREQQQLLDQVEPLQEISINKMNRQAAATIQMSESQEQLLLKSVLKRAGIENSSLH
jgi:hypothetical protein